ncbi:MAG: hypothetical protein ACR2GR_10720 [Rhodothermales bacterium]
MSRSVAEPVRETVLGPGGLEGQVREAGLLGPVTLQRVSRPPSAPPSN